MSFHVVRGVASSQGLRWRRAWLGAGLLIVLIPSLLLAQEPPATEPAPAGQEEPSEQAVPVFSGTVEVGSRGAERTRIDTPVPVDMLPIQELADDSGQFDIGQLLQYVAPSFNSNRQSGSDGSDHVDSATLRGLGPDQVLVLINGKRRHSSSLVYLFGSRSRGNVGTDLNTIPINAIDRIEILRDGASAQYGSDAIAGVINIILRSEPGLDVALGAGGYTAGDGDYGQAAFNYGLGLGEKGHAEHHRRVPDPRQDRPLRPRGAARHRRRRDRQHQPVLQPVPALRREVRVLRRRRLQRARRPRRSLVPGRHRQRRHPVAELGGDVPRRLRARHRDRHRGPLDDRRRPHLPR